MTTWLVPLRARLTSELLFKFSRCISSIPTSSTTESRLILGRYSKELPVDLARVQLGRNVRLRDYETQRALKRYGYDLKVRDGLIWPAEGDDYIGLNGCSLRKPLSPTFQKIVRKFRGSNVLVFIIPKGTPIHPRLTILHEHLDHYSMQCTTPMTLDALNEELTRFITKHGRILNKAQFDKEYPFSVEPAQNAYTTHSEQSLAVSLLESGG